jgi:hypothetical protein
MGQMDAIVTAKERSLAREMVMEFEELGWRI